MAKHNKTPFRIFKRGEIWHTYFSVVANGRRIVVRESCGTTDENTAKEYCARRMREIVECPAVTHEITLDAAATKWYLEYGQYLSNPTDAFSKIKNLLEDMNKNLLLSKITKWDINQYITISQQRGRSPATINRYLCLFSAICTRASTHWECNVPDFKILQFRQKEPKETIKYFHNFGEIQKLIDSSAPHIRPILYTALYTGLRLGRILTLKWEQIDWENNQIIYINKDGQPHTVPLVSALHNILANLPRVSEYVFTYKGKHIKSIKTAYHSAFKRAEIPYLNFHTIRHTTATWLLRDTGNLKIVQNVLGHHDISVTTKYAHLLNNEAQNALENLFAPIKAV